MKVFLINLDRDQERLKAADAQLKALGVEYEWIPAVYGKSLSQEEKQRKVNRFRWWCAVGRSMTDGELGCALSHAAVYRWMGLNMTEGFVYDIGNLRSADDRRAMWSVWYASLDWLRGVKTFSRWTRSVIALNLWLPIRLVAILLCYIPFELKVLGLHR